MIERYIQGPTEAVLKSDAERFGTKFAVQKLFYDLGMCGIETRLFEPQTPIERVREALLEMETNTQGFTVRFSFKDVLNLPRGFFRRPQECLDFISKERRGYAIIIQEYTQLVNSFELYSDGSLLYLQVLPGIWEVDTEEAPDIIQEKDGNLTIWRFRQPRQAKLTNSENRFYTEEQEPFSFMKLQEFYGRLELYRDRLEIVRKTFDPLFCHFYENNKGRLCFINVRDVGNVPINEDSPLTFHVIKGTFDIEKWDGNRPILFDVQAERGDDAPLVTTIRSLRDKGVKSVFVNCGILSHPAILLREAGIQVQQSYLLYEKQIMSTQNKELKTKQHITTVALEAEGQTKTGILNKDNLIAEQELHSLYLIRLDQISDNDSNLVGNKAYNLSKLANAGFLIPRGFVITTRAFREWLENKDIRTEVSDQIFQACQALSLKKVAVRSSSMVEDLSQASSAGVYKTSLNITKGMLIDAIIEGFQSVYDPNAQAYRLDRSIGSGIDMAVIVQEMIDAEVSGVLFTRNPLNHNTDEFVVNATFGLGEPLVSGKIPGDTYIISKEGGEIIDSIITQKDTILTGNGEVSLVEPIKSSRTLNDSQINQLVQIGKEIEKLFDSPQDIEFAITQNKIWILQSRPITQPSR